MKFSSNNLRVHILTTASELFYRKGIQHVGVNEVIAASDVAKRTFYKYFPSKDQLIVEVMHYQYDQWLSWFKEAVATRGTNAKEQLLETFNILEEWYLNPNFRGCPFLNAVFELADTEHPAHQVSVMLRQAIRIHIIELAKEAGLRNPEVFSQQYLLLIGGASLMAAIEGCSQGAQYARQVLSVLIDSNLS
ncbi:transcriptional regulator [Hapalosiphon sp. MRB220]|nr:transcriptional regulator [Hapalosiphon sp. MRB220]